jgi:hypothetical protein
MLPEMILRDHPYSPPRYLRSTWRPNSSAWIGSPSDTIVFHSARCMLDSGSRNKNAEFGANRIWCPGLLLQFGANSATVQVIMENTNATGWVVQVTTPAPITRPGTADTRWLGPTVLSVPSFQYFNTAVSAAEKAVEATAKHLSTTDAAHGELSAVRKLSSRELAVLNLAPGEVKPA